MNKKGHFNIEQAMITAFLVVIPLILFFVMFNNSQVTEVKQSPIESVTELQNNYDSCIKETERLNELVDWNCFEENQELEEKLDKKTSTLGLIFCVVIWTFVGYGIGRLHQIKINEKKKRKKK